MFQCSLSNKIFLCERTHYHDQCRLSITNFYRMRFSSFRMRASSAAQRSWSDGLVDGAPMFGLCVAVQCSARHESEQNFCHGRRVLTGLRQRLHAIRSMAAIRQTETPASGPLPTPLMARPTPVSSSDASLEPAPDRQRRLGPYSAFKVLHVIGCGDVTLGCHFVFSMHSIKRLNTSTSASLRSISAACFRSSSAFDSGVV